MAICITWPSFTFTRHVLFIISTQKSIFPQHLHQWELFWSVFTSSIAILKEFSNLNLTFAVCCKPDSKSLYYLSLSTFLEDSNMINRITRLLCEISLCQIKTPSSLSMEMKDNKFKTYSIYVVVQFYPWFKFSFLLFQTNYHVIIIHYHTQKQKEPRIKLNYNIYR